MEQRRGAIKRMATTQQSKVKLEKMKLASYMDKIRKFEKDMLRKRKQAIFETFF